jgi:hypothetical protein
VNPPDSELSGSVKCEEFSDQLRKCQLSSRSLLLLCGELRSIASPPSHDVDQAVCSPHEYCCSSAVSNRSGSTSLTFHFLLFVVLL